MRVDDRALPGIALHVQIADKDKMALRLMIPGLRHRIAGMVHGKTHQLPAQQIRPAAVNLRNRLIFAGFPIADQPR
jgi:hypothetical protein